MEIPKTFNTQENKLKIGLTTGGGRITSEPKIRADPSKDRIP